MRNLDFEVIVVGGGHAGIEACLATSRLGHSTLLVTSNIDRIGYMSCNPSIGGLAKGHMVREIDILGGQMGVVADETCIQYKRLNSSRGPAVRGTRVQSDKIKYSRRMKEVLYKQANLKIFQGEVKGLLVENSRCHGVILSDGSSLRAGAVIITTGTFMNAVMHFGFKQLDGGRIGDKNTTGLSDQIKSFGISVSRFKTGTPARLHKDSIDYVKTQSQFGDETYFPFSLGTTEFPKLPQVSCFLTRTTSETHDIIRNNLDKSPMYCGIIEGVGPRYCPSIEDKVIRFSERDSHHTFLEPESLESDLIYLQGISTSLPEEVQDKFIRTIPGLESVRIVRYGYAVEYDYFDPMSLNKTLETKYLSHLFFAGQINGTSGYEEAAAQGLIAGINASRLLNNNDFLILERHDAYIGVLIDDLVTKGTPEPYRMFTSRAEHRLVLREDNTVDRLIGKSKDIGLINNSYLQQLDDIKKSRSFLKNTLKNTRLYPNQQTQEKLVSLNSAPLLKSITLEELLRRPEINGLNMGLFLDNFEYNALIFDAVEIDVKYSGYISRQNDLISQAARLDNFKLDVSLDYMAVKGLSSEEVEKLNRVKPLNIGQARRISGVNPSAIQSIIIYYKGHRLAGVE